MKNYFSISFFLVCFFTFFSAVSQNRNESDSLNKSASIEYYQEAHDMYKDFIFKKNIHTVTLNKPEFELSVPLINLNSDEQLKLSFDDFDGDAKNYKFSFVHCDAYWQPSDILPYQFEKGFDEDYITDYSMSLNTIQKYTHYNLLFPTENMKIVESGNYILKVFVEGNNNDIVLTKRFMVLDEKVSVNGQLKRPTYVEDMDYKQQIDFTINYAGYDIPNPYNDLKVIIQQNGRWDNTLKDLKPRMVQNNMLVYDFQRENVMNGGNEFRRFDIKTLRTRTERVMKIQSDNNSKFTHVYLYPDINRSVKTYLTDHDINGKYIIKSEDNIVRSSDIESEYVYVHFTLPYKNPLVDGSLYVLGALVNWDFSNQSKMVYNFNTNAYELVLYLKQGYYNYQYVFLENGKSKGDETFIEGNHYETENDYFIYIYHREQGTSYDKLIGVKALNSRITQQ